MIWLYQLGFFCANSETNNFSGSISILSPPIDGEGHALDAATYKDGGLYLLRKESERRSTLVKVMTEDEDLVGCLCHSLICNTTVM